MNPYPQRIADMHAFLADRYGQHDAQATEVLLACLLDSNTTGLRVPWIVIETDWMNRDTREAWFSFGGAATVRSLTAARIHRSMPCATIMDEWLSSRRAGGTGLFVDAEWRRLFTLRARGAIMYRTFLTQCLKLRTEYPKGLQGLKTYVQHDTDSVELARLAGRVLECSLRPPRTASETAKCLATAPAGMLYWCEMMQKLSPVQGDWEILTGGLAAVACGIASLYNDGRKPDWLAADRVLRDCVPHTTAWILSKVGVSRTEATRAWQLYQQTTGSESALKGEIKRLREAGVLLNNRVPAADRNSFGFWKYRIAHWDWVRFIDRKQTLLV